MTKPLPQMIPYFQVNSFSDQPFGGNPAGVCPLGEWLPVDLMQQIALENNLSETAFFIPLSDDTYHLRWFTPTSEVLFCGHATLASGFVLLHKLRTDLAEVKFKAKIGHLSVRKGMNGLMILDAPSLPGIEFKTTPDHLNLFNKKPSKVLKSSENFLFVFDGGVSAIEGLMPNLKAMEKFPEYGFIATSLGTDTDFVSRYFAPAWGVPEDPITGSAHSVLVPYWAEVLGKTEMTARQGLDRKGDLFLKLKGERVDISGNCFLLKEGVFHLR